MQALLPFLAESELLFRMDSESWEYHQAIGWRRNASGNDEEEMQCR